VLAEALRANIDWKPPFLLKGVGQFGPTFQVEGVILHQPFSVAKLDASAFHAV